MTERRKFLLGKTLIDAMLAAGLIDDHTTAVTIRAAVGEKAFLEITQIGDERLLDLTSAMVETDDSTEAIAT